MKPKVIDRINVQDKVLDDKIGVLNNDRGYLVTKRYDKNQTNLSEIYYNSLVCGWFPDAPTTDMYTVQTINWSTASGTHSPGWCTQVANMMGNSGGGANNTDAMYIRSLQNGKWNDWKQLANKQLLDDRGYLKSIEIQFSNLDTIVETGFYKFNGIVNTSSSVWWDLQVRNFNTNYCIQEITQVTNPGGNSLTTEPLKFFRARKVGGTWTEWYQVATTTKIPFSCTAKTGFTILRQNCFIQNGFAYISMLVKKTDETAFTIGNHDVVTNPKSPTVRMTASVLCHSGVNGSGIVSGGNGHITEANVGLIGFVNDNASTKSVIINGCYPI